MKLNRVSIPLIISLLTFPLLTQEQCVSEVVGSPFAAGVSPFGVAFSPLVTSNNLFAAVTNQSDDTVSVYAVNTTTGTFTQVTGSPFATGPLPKGIAISQLVNGNLFAAVANGSAASISVYSINQITGFFTPVAGSPFTTPVTNQNSVAYAPFVGGNLFAASVGTGLPSNLVSVYAVNTTTGAFSAGTTFATGTAPRSVAYSPVFNGTLFAAVTNALGGSISVYTVNQTTGALTAVAGSPFAAGSFVNFISFSPIFNGNLYLLVNNQSSNSAQIFSVSTTGTLTLNQTITGFVGSPRGVAYSPIVNGKLYAAIAEETNLHIYSVNAATGQFTEISGSPFPLAGIGFGIAFSPVVNNQLFLASANTTDNTTVYRIGFPPVLATATATCSTRLITATGAADANTALSLLANGSVIGSGSTDSSGNFAITATAPLTDGTYTITILQNSSCQSNSLLVTISCTIPPTPAPFSNQNDLVRAIRNKYCSLRTST